jgi:hypothetical protein
MFMLETENPLQPKILVIQNEFVSEMRLALEYAGFGLNDPSAMKQQITAILEQQSISAAILDTSLEQQAATSIADILVELDIPFVFAGADNQAEIPERVAAYTMAPDMANLTVVAHSLLGAPTLH